MYRLRFDLIAPAASWWFRWFHLSHHGLLVRLLMVALVAATLSLVGARSVAVPAGAASDPLDFEDVPAVESDPLPLFDPGTSESETAAEGVLGDTFADVPADAEAVVVVDETWSMVDDMPVTVRVDESVAPEPSDPAPSQPTPEPEPTGSPEPAEPSPDSSTDGTGVEAVPVGAEVQVTLDRPANLKSGAALLLEVEAPADVAEPNGPEGPTEPVVAAGGVEVSVSYADFDQLYGGNYGDRLEVWAYPGCFAVTPLDPECSRGIPVEAENRTGTDKLVFTTLDPVLVLGDGSGAVVSPPIDLDGLEGGPGDAVPPSTGTASTVAAEEPRTPVVYALSSGTQNYRATPVNPASEWQVGTGSGEFTYSYPIELPQPLAGPAPTLSLNYSSGSVDAMTTENAQASAVGTGWADLEPGSISRSFTDCQIDATSTYWDGKGDSCWRTVNGELVEELTITLNGRSSRLKLLRSNVNDGPPNAQGQRTNDASVVTDDFRLIDDPGWRVVRKKSPSSSGASTSLVDDNNERWVVFTPDGLRYHFGSRAVSGSRWVKPVFGNHAGEPCNIAGDIPGSWCQQAWRWTLDRVVDPSGNEQIYTYTPETNYYRRLGTTNTRYHILGLLQRIDYGIWRDPQSPGATSAPPRQSVTITTTDRCTDTINPETSGIWDCATTNDDSPKWPDTPLDLYCEPSNGETCSYAPTIFTTRKYRAIETHTYSGPGAGTDNLVRTYRLRHRWPLPEQDTLENTTGEPADLWLRVVQVLGDNELPNTRSVQFHGTSMNNLVTPDANGSLKKFRITAIRTEYGGRIDVDYDTTTTESDQVCNATYINATGRTRFNSTKRCFAVQKFDANGGVTDIRWFHKYVVDRVLLSDDALHYRAGTSSAAANLGEAQVFDYEYVGAPAWRFGDSRNVKNERETWDDWRGYETTITRQLAVADQVATGTVLSETRTVRFRGMDYSWRNATFSGDTNRYDSYITTNEPGDGGANGFNVGPEDSRWLQGLVAETEVKAPGGDLITRDYTGYGALNVNTQSTDYLAKRVYTAFTNRTTRVGSGSSATLRSHRIDYGVISNVSSSGVENGGLTAGVVDAVWDRGLDDGANGDDDPADDTCQITGWRANDDDWHPGAGEYAWLRVESSKTLYDGTCTLGGRSDNVRTSTGNGNPIGKSQVFYDGDHAQGAGTQAPLTRGLATRTQTHTRAGQDEDDADLIVTETGYDQYGRPTSTVDPRGMTTTTGYNPSDTPGGAGDGDLLQRMRVTVTPGEGGAPDLGAQESDRKLVTTTDFHLQHGLPTRVEEPNGGITEMEYSPLGLLWNVWLPSNPRAQATAPSIKHRYFYSLSPDGQNPDTTEDKPFLVQTSTLMTKATGNTAAVSLESFAFFDGWGRPIQTQAPSPTTGRSIVTSTRYDERGQVDLTTAAYSITYAPTGTRELQVPNLNDVPRFSTTGYDAAGRPTAARDHGNSAPGGVYRTTTTDYLGDRTVVTHPTAGTGSGQGTTTTLLDVWDRPRRVELANSVGATPEQVLQSGDAADYTYTEAGDLDTITKTFLPSPGEVGNITAVWDYDYDWAGRRIRAVDPDTGITDTSYDTAGNIVEVESYGHADPEGTDYGYGDAGDIQTRITTSYDGFHRPVKRDGAQRDCLPILAGQADSLDLLELVDDADGDGLIPRTGCTAGNSDGLENPKTLAEWFYDTAPGGKGMLAATQTTVHAGLLDGLAAPPVSPFDLDDPNSLEVLQQGLLDGTLDENDVTPAWHYASLVTGYDADGNQLGEHTRYPSWLTGQTDNGQAVPAGSEDTAAHLASDADVGYTHTRSYNAHQQPTQIVFPPTPGSPGGPGAEGAYTVDLAYEPTGGRLAAMTSGTGTEAETLGSAAYDAIGQPAYLSSSSPSSGAGLARMFTFEFLTGRLATTSAVENPTAPQSIERLKLAYSYDKSDNPLTITGSVQDTADAGSTTSANWCYDYDQLDRLTRAQTGTVGPGGTCAAPADSAETTQVRNVTGDVYDYGYSYSGDRLAEVETPGTGTPTATRAYQWTNTSLNSRDNRGAAVGVHQTTQITATPTTPPVEVTGLPSAGPLEYDDLGRATRQPGPLGLAAPLGPTGSALSSHTIYDTQGAPTLSLTPTTATDAPAVLTTAAFEADGMRIARRTLGDLNVLATTVYLAGGLTEITSTPAGGVDSDHHITTPGGTPLATVTNDAAPGGVTTSRSITWKHADPQGNIRVTQAAAGTSSPIRQHYYPYGTPVEPGPLGLPGPAGLQPDTPTTKGYLGKTHDPNGDIRLDHRNYTPFINVLSAPDPILDPSDPATANPYAYARNNPIKYNDATGLMYDGDAMPPDTCSGNASIGYDCSGGRCTGGGCDEPDQPALSPHASYADELGDEIDAYEEENGKSFTEHLIETGKFFIFDPAQCRDVLSGSCALEVGTAIPVLKPLKVFKYTDEVIDAVRGSDKARDTERGVDAANAGRKACSFTGGTVVLMADGSKKPIEGIEVGDKVIATDPKTGEQAAKTVEHVWVHDDTVVDLVVAGEVITTTEDHPFWSVTDQRFERADELSSGEKVRGADGRVITVSGLLLGTTRDALAFNLSVEGIHTYHVGDASILVHNENTCDRALWQITDAKSLTTKVVGGRKYSKQSDGTWWSRDTAGHGDSAWKVYREVPGGLKWYRDADKYGTYIDPALKHKSDVGMIVRW